MSLSTTETKRLIQACFPPGSEQIYDWDNPNANIGQFFTAMAGVWKTYGTDICDTLRDEINPLTCTQNIAAWERALGLSNTPLAVFGTTAQRRKAVLSWLRQTGTFSVADIQAVVQPYFNYADASQIQVVEPDRTTLTTQHTYANAGVLSILPNSNGESTITVADDPVVSKAGAIISFNLTATIDQLGFYLFNPDGRVAQFETGYLGSGIVANTTYTVRTKRHVGYRINGIWTLGFYTGAAAFTMNGWTLMVEGLGVNYAADGSRNGEGLGSAMFEWAVVADRSKLGTGYDLKAAERALRRMKPAHTQVWVVLKGTGGLPMIYDDADSIYEQGVFG